MGYLLERESRQIRRISLRCMVFSFWKGAVEVSTSPTLPLSLSSKLGNISTCTNISDTGANFVYRVGTSLTPPSGRLYIIRITGRSQGDRCFSQCHHKQNIQALMQQL